MSTEKNIRNVWKERAEDLYRLCESRYGVKRADMRVILACLLPTAPDNPCWIVCETTQTPFWEDLHKAVGGLGAWAAGEVMNVSSLRRLRPHWANKFISQVLAERGKVRVFTDFESKMPKERMLGRHMYPDLISQCLRIRVDAPKMVNLQPNSYLELTRALKLAVGEEFRPYLPAPMQIPELLLHHAGVLTRLNNELSNSRALLSNLSILGPALAVADGRDKMQEQDHRDVLRVMQDSIRLWTYRILRNFVEFDGATTINDLHTYTNYPHRILTPECGRLDEELILDWPPPKHRGNRRKFIRLHEANGPDARQLAAGEVVWW